MSAVAKPVSNPVSKPASEELEKPVRRARTDHDKDCVENKWVETTQKYVRAQNISEALNGDVEFEIRQRYNCFKCRFSIRGYGKNHGPAYFNRTLH